MIDKNKVYEVWKIGKEAFDRATNAKASNEYGEFMIRWNCVCCREKDALAGTWISEKVPIGLVITNKEWEFFFNSSDKLPQVLKDLIREANEKIIYDLAYEGYYFEATTADELMEGLEHASKFHEKGTFWKSIEDECDRIRGL